MFLVFVLIEAVVNVWKWQTKRIATGVSLMSPAVPREEIALMMYVNLFICINFLFSIIQG